MINLVHDIVRSYRNLIDANSYPGDVYSFTEFIKNNSINVPFYKETLLFVYMLLDAEVTFAVIGDENNKACDLISQLTYAKTVDIEAADFIFILSKAEDDEKEKAIRNAKIGTLIDPHLSATIICEVKSVKDGKSETIYGPGIKGEKQIRISYENWNKVRYQKNLEYPLGIEMYFVDEDGDILALPRTTQVKGCV